MKLLFIILPITAFLSFSSTSQVAIRYANCDCIDSIDTIIPLPSGSYIRTCNNAVIEKGTFISGLKTGEWFSYNLKGNLIKKITYVNGALDGEVLYFYNSGKKKLSGSFSNGLKTGDWKFYNQDEKIQWSLSYNDGIPTGKSLIYDRKGKKIVISYDYDKKNYDVNNENFSLFSEEAEVLQDPISSEWFYLLLVDPTGKTKEMELNQRNVESQLFLSLIEIPREIFNTYLNVNYNVEMTFENSGLMSIELKREKANGEEYPLFAFGAMTNDPEKLSRNEPLEFTLLLLDSKVKEAFSIFPPWQIANGNFNMAFIYNINLIEK